MFTDSGPSQASSGLFTGGKASRKGTDLSGPQGVCLMPSSAMAEATRGSGLRDAFHLKNAVDPFER